MVLVLSGMALTVSAGEWGIGASMRYGSIPYQGSDSDTVKTITPQILYEGDRLFLRENEYGIRAYRSEKNQFNAILQQRFVNIPKEYQNQYQPDSLDWGVQWLHSPTDKRNWRLEVLTESYGNTHAYLGHDWQFKLGHLELKTSIGGRYKTSGFNSYYYGLSEHDAVNGQNLSSGIDGELGISFRYPILGGLYLTGGIDYTWLDPQARNSPVVDQNSVTAFTLGFTYFESSKVSNTPTFAEGSYLRLAHGWATPSDIDSIIKFRTEDDPHNNQLSSVFYGHPLARNWFDTQFDIYLTGGLAYHYSSPVQKDALEAIVAIKAYYNFQWPVRWRLGFAEGLSYVSRVPYIEAVEMEREQMRGSKLLNYLDVSLDVNIGDVSRQPGLSNMWLGWSVHHRSGIFRQASQFGRIDGGSNYNTVYLQWQF